MAKKPTSTLPASWDEDLPSSLALLAGEGDLLIAVSGGPDSMALLHLVALWRASLPGPARPKIFAASVDHGLRPGARAEAELAGAMAKELGIPHVILDWQAGAEGKVTSRIQERARAARYELLAAHAAKFGARAIVTGHHGDDQAQTLLFRLLRGSSPAGLAGMRKRSVRQGQAGLAGHAGHGGHGGHAGHGGYVILRPLLDVPKARLIAWCRAHGVDYAEDPSNRDPRFARTRLSPLLAAMEAEGLDGQGWARLARRAARMDEALARQARALFARFADRGADRLEMDFAALAGEAEEIVQRVLALALESAGTGARVPLRLERLERLTSQLLAARGQARALAATLAGCRLRLDAAGRVIITPEKPRARGRNARESVGKITTRVKKTPLGGK